MRAGVHQPQARGSPGQVQGRRAAISLFKPAGPAEQQHSSLSPAVLDAGVGGGSADMLGGGGVTGAATTAALRQFLEQQPKVTLSTSSDNSAYSAAAAAALGAVNARGATPPPGAGYTGLPMFNPVVSAGERKCG